MDESKYTIASRKRWIGVSKAQRARRMSIVSKARWSRLSVEQKRSIALTLVKCRKNKTK